MKKMENIGLGLSIIGLIFMVVMYLVMDNINYVNLGLIVVAIGLIINTVGKRKASNK